MPNSRRKKRGGADGSGARRSPGWVLRTLPKLCAAWLTVLLLCRLLVIPVGSLGELALALLLGLLGRAAPLLPAVLLLPSVKGTRELGRSAPMALLLLSALLEDSAAPLSSAFRRGQAGQGGGLIGALLSRICSALAGRVGAPLALAVLLLSSIFRTLGVSPRAAANTVRRLLSPKRKHAQSADSTDTIGKDTAMLGFRSKRKKPVIVDDGGYYPVGDSAENFSQVRARLEKEESAKTCLVRDEERVCYPAAAPTVQAPAEYADESSPRSILTEVSDLSQSDATVLPASEVFGKSGSFTESERFASILSVPEAARIAAVRRATDAPFARPGIPDPVSTPSVSPSQASSYAPPAAPPPSTPNPSAEQPPLAPAPAPQAPSSEDLPFTEDKPDPAAEPRADAVFGKTDALALDASRISDAALPPITTSVIPPSTSDAPLAPPTAESTPYTYPPLSLLNPSASVGGSTDEEIRQNSQNLLDTLESFNVKASIRHVSRGPRITRYEIVPDKGVRIRAIVNLQDDISMNLAAAGIRIEAPIPGLSAVGVEVPNSRPSAVCLRDMLDNEAFRSASSKTTICVGSDVTGKPVYGDIGKMPHALIAGATGMGKSVCINTILLSLLYKAHPDEVKLILVDPKKVEFAPYNGIPHLLVPVVIEPQKAAGALVWAVGEMERRFNMIEQAGVRDIKGYNRIAAESPDMGKPLPQIVIVIDELNDLMMSARDAVEDAICRIAQKARAAGIHLLIGTQRPSVDVITGVIKANIPSRMAFHVSSQVDSRTILDITGAEKLLDKGDMLFFPVGAPKPIRVQGALVTDDEVTAVTTFLKRGMSGAPVYDDEIMANIEREAEKCAPKDKRADRSADEDFEADGSDVFAESQFVAAVEVALKLGQISTSKIQTKLRIGFQKASNYIEKMEELGIVGPSNGSKPRDVLITADQFLEMKARH